jgi:DNA adenine methylase
LTAIARPFLKWPGGKRRVANYILPFLGLPAGRLVEPFCGGCAVSFAVAGQAQSLWLNDLNADLTELLRRIQRDPHPVIERGQPYFRPENNEQTAFYRLRDEFNQTRDPLARSALFLYLNRHGYNGLCRYNADGGFNVPFGRYAAPRFPAKEILAAAPILAKAKITCLDFEEVMDACVRGDVIYCDPPYVPLSATSSFTAYSAGGFGPPEQERLARAAERTAARGILVVISNHDTPLTRGLYEAAKLQSIEVRRNISRDGAHRELVKEIIAVYEHR